MLLFNFKVALRNIWKNKVFSGINITGLALSLACCLVIAMYVLVELRHDSFHNNLEDIYRITEKQDQAGTMYNVAVTPGPLAPALQKDFPEIAQTVRFGKWSGLLKNDKHVYEEGKILLTENSVFSVFNFPLVKGNTSTALLSPDEIVITESAANKYFGKDWRSNPNILNQIFRLNNETDFKLTAIAKDPPENSSIQFDILLPLSFLFKSDEFSNKWNSNNYHTYLLLKKGTDVNAFAKKVEKKLSLYSQSKDILLLQPLKKEYLHSNFDFQTDWGKRGNIKYIKIFAGAGLLLLIIACANFINLSTARFLKRSMEAGIRKVNGATRQQLVFQFLSESLLMACISGTLSVCIIATAQPLFIAFNISSINIVFQSALFIPLLISLILIIGFAAGIYPAFVLSASSPLNTFKRGVKHRSGKLLRRALVIVQFTVSVILITCTVFMYQQFHYMQDKDLGFNKDYLLSIGLGGDLKQKAQLFSNDVSHIPGVINVAPATASLTNVSNGSYLEWDGMKESDKFLITQANVTPTFIPALSMQLISGNNFSTQKSTDTANYIVNEAAVKSMGLTSNSIIGKRVSFWGTKGNIIGVVKDFHFKPLSVSIEPFILRYQPLENYYTVFVKIAPGKTKEVIDQTRKLYKKYEADAPFNYSFVSESVNSMYSDDKRTAGIILLFACLTIFVGCLGLFGLTVFTTELRVKEIGIRKVLGADILSVTTLICKDFLALVVLAVFIAAPAAWFATAQWLNSYAYRINMDWRVCLYTGCLVAFMALITTSIHAVKAAIANPVKSLRTE